MVWYAMSAAAQCRLRVASSREMEGSRGVRSGTVENTRRRKKRPRSATTGSTPCLSTMVLTQGM
jgi:hypothetical protein